MMPSFVYTKHNIDTIITIVWSKIQIKKNGKMSPKLLIVTLIHGYMLLYFENKN